MPDDAPLFGVEIEAVGPDPSGYPAPRRFRIGRREVGVAEILDRWPGQDHFYVKLQGSDGALYILRHDRGRALWQLVLFQRQGG